MFRSKLYILLFFLNFINFSLNQRFLKLKPKLLFIINNFYLNKHQYGNILINIIEDVQRDKNKYTSQNHSLLFLKKGSKAPKPLKTRKKIPSEPKKRGRKPKKVVEELKEELESVEDVNSVETPEEEKEVGEELLISNRMLYSLLLLTSSLHYPTFYDMLPVLYTIKDQVLGISVLDENDLNSDEKASGPKKKVKGMFVTNPEGLVEKLVISIPTKALRRLSQSPRYKIKVDVPDSPFQLISLSQGFFTKVYQMTIQPFLSQTFQDSLGIKLEKPCGFMDYIVSSEDSINLNSFDYKKLKAIRQDEFTRVFKDIKIPFRGDFDITLVSEKTRKYLAMMIKCVKDLVYFKSCLSLLEHILGRKPTDSEILYSFHQGSPSEGFEPTIPKISNDSETFSKTGSTTKTKLLTKDESKRLSSRLLEIIDYSEDEFEHRYDKFFDSFVTVALDYFVKNMEKKKRYFKNLISCHKDAMIGIKSKIFGLNPKTMGLMSNSFIPKLFEVAYFQVKLSAILQNLPDHLPLSTFKLARMALILNDHLEYIQNNIISQYKNGLIDPKELESMEMLEGLSLKGKEKIQINREDYLEYVRKIIEIENYFKDRKRLKLSNEFMRSQQHENLLKKTLAKILKVSVDRLSEALDALERKTVLLRTKIPKHMRPRLKVPPFYGRKCRYFSELEGTGQVYDEKTDPEYYRDMIYTRTMRKIAIEAIDDRLARLLFMARNRLLIDPRPNYDEIIESLGIPKKTADFIVFISTLICREYEVIRIKLNLPPYVNELKVYPPVLRGIQLDPNDLPYHINIALYNEAKNSIYPSVIDEHPISSKKGPKNKRESLRRQRSIKPKLGSPTELLANYKINYKEHEKILQKSPMYYLEFGGILNP